MDRDRSIRYVHDLTRAVLCRLSKFKDIRLERAEYVASSWCFEDVSLVMNSLVHPEQELLKVPRQSAQARKQWVAVSCRGVRGGRDSEARTQIGDVL
ncbi:MAG: hypothetical protein WCE62_01010, partial [Polyangiales bacterium]